ncbi:hypothetical protein PBRA_008900 [Plasmodiophora brassicae]|uniref:Uncharacterized protein n=1 Tax=Plasmodiophora brassicae TaxID=37360 RepID=A0A0G4J4V9_PLABS|nr:hypothetical protein PBRA_008900 [Plasmodiophora brassicae]
MRHVLFMPFNDEFDDGVSVIDSDSRIVNRDWVTRNPILGLDDGQRVQQRVNFEHAARVSVDPVDLDDIVSQYGRRQHLTTRIGFPAASGTAFTANRRVAVVECTRGSRHDLLTRDPRS